MREARVECRIRRYPLHEFGLDMRKGDVEHLPQEAARASRELTHAVKIGAVSVRYVERYKVSKKPPPKRPVPPSIRMSRPNRGGMGAPPAAPSEPPDKTTGLDEDELRRVIREEVRAAVAGIPAPKVFLDAESVQGLREALASAVQARDPAARPPVTSANDSADEPVYIPEGIVDQKAKAEIKVEAEASDAGSLDAASAALREAKPKEKRRKATKRASAPKE